MLDEDSGDITDIVDSSVANLKGMKANGVIHDFKIGVPYGVSFVVWTSKDSNPLYMSFDHLVCFLAGARVVGDFIMAVRFKSIVDGIEYN